MEASRSTPPPDPRPLPPPDFRRLFESAPGLYLVLTPDLRIVAASDAYLAATMTRREQIVGRDLFDVFPDDPSDPASTGVANLKASLERVLARRAPDTMAVQLYPVERPGGGFEERHWSPVNLPVLDEHGNVEYILHRVEDVTDFVRLKQHDHEQQRLAEELQTRTGSMETEIYRRAQEIQAANEELRALHAGLERRVEERTNELRRSEEQLRQSQKLEAIGRLAGGIAHDFNNLLSVILGHSDLMLLDLDPGDPHRADLEAIRSAGTRTAELTRQLLVFSRQQMVEPTVLSLNDVLDDVNRILVRLLGEDIELRVLPAGALGHVRADRSQLGQVVLNLVVNARDAMPTGGRLTLETANVDLDGEYARAHLGVAPGAYVMLAVSDTGIGMDRATQARIFEPFFTTKEQGKGTGLGLATVFGIVRQAGGAVWVYSEPGKGSTFKVYLPRVDEAATNARSGDDAMPALARGSETILLVEDEDLVRGVTKRILVRAGYRVIEARSPHQALILAEQEAGRIDLVLTDVIMPKMNGRQLADRLLAERPGLRILFMSGYTDDVILQHGVLDGRAPFLQKPVSPDDLTRKVREVLDRP